MTAVAEKKWLLEQVTAWYVFEVPLNILIGWKNFLIFGLNYFSTPLLIKTFFSYWHRYRWSYGRGFDLQRYFEAFTFNLISRLLGAIIRTFFIMIGFVFEILIFVVGLVIFLGWLFLPLLLLAGLSVGIRLLLF